MLVPGSRFEGAGTAWLKPENLAWELGTERSRSTTTRRPACHEPDVGDINPPMLIIRKAQMQALDVVQRRQFVVDLSAALQDQYPGMRRVCTAEGFLAAVEQCVDNSLALGFDAGGEIAQYVMLCLLFGRNFTSDPLLPWSADSLRYAGPARMPHLTAAAEFHTRCVSGAGNRFLLRAVERWLFAVVAMSASTTPADIAETYPEKAAGTPSGALRQFLSAAAETIRVRNLREPVAR